jgi:hypothetical protein
MPTVKVEGDENVDVRPGEEVVLEVPGANTSSDAVEVVGHEVIPDEESFGGAGVERFTLRPLREGNATVHLELKAPWDSDVAESHDVHVHSVAADK